MPQKRKPKCNGDNVHFLKWAFSDKLPTSACAEDVSHEESLKVAVNGVSFSSA
jgi:hypothetical protein